ncbi:MAG TPA: flagellar biosynthetic protein FliO [Solirubrobacteraceae bacterium]|nr:flagellar biosynthetic protein FliO [Solirubrobacteraceae bacterium]
MTHAHIHHVVPRPNTAFEATRLPNLKLAGTAHASSGTGGSILHTIVGLVIVIAVIYGLTLIVRRLKAKDLPAAGDSLERIASLPLGTNRSVALVRVGSELHLLGVGEQSVTPIRSFTEDEAIELGLPVTPPGAVIGARNGVNLGARASALLGRSESTSFGERLDSLKRMTQR